MNSDDVNTGERVCSAFERKLSLTILSLAILILIRLFVSAVETDNWPGFWYSSLHVVIVGVGSYLALRR